jgi:hypothetical protein
MLDQVFPSSAGSGESDATWNYEDRYSNVAQYGGGMGAGGGSNQQIIASGGSSRDGRSSDMARYKTQLKSCMMRSTIIENEIKDVRAYLLLLMRGMIKVF